MSDDTNNADNGKPKNIMRFFNDMQDQATRDRLGPSLALVPPGRWDLFIQWAAANGYVAHGHDIADALSRRPALTKRLAEHPVLKGWSDESLAAHNAKNG